MKPNLVKEIGHLYFCFASSMLRHLGYRADVVANGLEVLHALERQR